VTTTSGADNSTVTSATTVTTVSGNITSTFTSDVNGTVISFPSITSTSANFTSTSTSTFVSLSSTPSVNSEFTFVTQSTLFLDTSSTTETPSSSATDSDVPSTTFTLSSISSAAPDSKPTTPALPPDLPLQILPAEGAHPGDPDLAGYSQISILFDAGLNWKFVAGTQKSSSQIFAWMPPILQASLGLTESQVKTYELKCYVPKSYQGVDDVEQLQTMWVGYIPTDNVDTLAQQLKVTSSAFYTSLQSPYSDLAQHVVSSFPVTTAVGSGDSGSGSGGNGASSSSGSSSSKSRENAIIGVVSSLGAIALLILAFLVFRAVKQRRALAHRRLSDPHQTEFIGAPPDDHEFDRDSVGGQRRRSFYYAADSLRSAHPEGAAEDPFTNASAAPGSAAAAAANMRERRPQIGAPILRDNTMNW
ncbi:hypothetical protein BD413DRAFT_471050, partial [Trametes elegans]